jgi:hypothetical protein
MTPDDLSAARGQIEANPFDELPPDRWQLLERRDGYISDLAGGAMTRYRGDGDELRSMSIWWTATESSSIDLLRATHPADPGCEAMSLLRCGTISTEVRGNVALLSSAHRPAGDGYRLSWLEPDGRMVIVESTGISEEELLLTADGLRSGTWDELVGSEEMAQHAMPDTTFVPETRPSPALTGSPARDDESARALVGDPRFQLRPIVESRGQRDVGWGPPRSPSDAEPLPPDAPATVLGVTVDGWYPGAHELAAAVLDGSGLVDAYPLTSPANAFSVRGDRVWLRFDTDAQALLAALADECTGGTDICPTGRVAVVWGDEVIAVADLASGPVGSTLTIEVGSWGRSRWPE